MKEIALKLTVKAEDLPEDMLVLRDWEMIEKYKADYPMVDPKKLGRLAIALFRGTEEIPNAPDNDYLGVGQLDDEGNETWHIFFERYPEMAYLSGLAYNKEREGMLHKMLRSNSMQSFGDKFGWMPHVDIEDLPSEAEQEAYVQYLLSKHPDLHEDLESSLREEFDESD